MPAPPAPAYQSHAEQFDFDHDETTNSEASPRPRKPWNVVKLGIGAVVLVVLACGGFLAFSFFKGGGPIALPFAGEPETCKELAERLESRGMKIRWEQASSGGLLSGPSIYIARADFRQSEGEKGLSLGFWMNEIGPYAAGDIVTVEQLADAKTAKERAGTMKNGFSYGRFLIHGNGGHKELVEEIKSKL